MPRCAIRCTPDQRKKLSAVCRFRLFNAPSVAVRHRLSLIHWRILVTEQNASNHAKFFPPFHFFASPILLANFIWSFFRLNPQGYSAYSIFSVFVAAALVVTLLV